MFILVIGMPCLQGGAQQVFLHRQDQGGIDPQPDANGIENSLVGGFVKNQDAGIGNALYRGQQGFKIGQPVAKIRQVIKICHDDSGRIFTYQADGLTLRPFGDHGIAQFLIQLFIASRANECIDHEQRG